MPDIVADGDNLGDHIATKSFKQIKGSDVASADAVTLGFGGNTFDVTGTTTINHINNTNWVVGSVVIIHFDGATTLTNNAGGLTGSEANILLSGDANYTTTAGDILTFVLHDSTSWQEVSRNSVASIPDDSITNAKLATGIDAVKLADGSVTNSELKYINTLSDNAQTQLDLKAPLISPTFVTPVLGTPASGALTNCTALPASQLTVGTMQSGMTIPDPTLTFSINAQTGTTYTPVLSDSGKIVTLNNGSAITLTIPPNSSVAYPVGSSLTFISIGAGLTTFAQGSGVTIASAGGTSTAPVITARHNSATAIKIATDTWQVIGALS